MNKTEYIIHQDWRGFGVWVATKDWRECNALDYFLRREQAEEFEAILLLKQYVRGLDNE